MKLSQSFFAFLMGFFIYSLMEIAGRGYTHWTMGLAGGTALMLMYIVNQRHGLRLAKSCFISSFIITAIELIAGIFDNIIMGWQVWDYSDMPLNFMGQICLPFYLCWLALSIPAYYLCRLIRNQFEPNQKPSFFSSLTIST